MNIIEIVYAQAGDAVVNSIVNRISDHILIPIIQFLFLVAALVFAWGMFKFIKDGGDPEARAQGQKHLIWGVVGIFIMMSAYGIVRLVANTVGQGGAIGF